MATISLNDSAPKEAIHFSLGFADFGLEGSQTFETDNRTEIAAAEQHPWLKVTEPVVDVKVASDYDENDPHDNPGADHLSEYASPETVAAAAANDERIREEVAVVQNVPVFIEPTPEPSPTPDPAPAPVVADSPEVHS